MPAEGEDDPPPSRIFGVLLEFNTGREVDRVPEFIEFTAPETGGPEQTLRSIAICRVETDLLQRPEFKKTGKNWKVVSVTEVAELY
jgi:hypothetical protein